MYTTRILTNEDRPQLEALLRKHSAGAMIMRGNLYEAGVIDEGKRFQAPYAGAFDGGGALRAVAAQYHGFDNLFAAADDEPSLDAAVRAAVAASERRVRGVIGLRWIVRRAREVLGLTDAPVQVGNDEGLYTLDLAQLRVPRLLSSPEAEVRALRPSDRERLVRWFIDYDMEALGSTETPALVAECESRFERTLSEGYRCHLVHRGIPRAITGFNATIPDCVQIGGVYTPRAQRRNGYARAAVAGSLLEARERGVLSAVLFTGDENVAAITAYRALGFERIDDFNITLFQ